MRRGRHAANRRGVRDSSGIVKCSVDGCSSPAPIATWVGNSLVVVNAEIYGTQTGSVLRSVDFLLRLEMGAIIQ
jgi:hypothetical protein